mmetsp:Transcript_19583/g.46764  ORF Transcript_19583/g.46764 Transcript_19583/m.46764 type:complete len:92 (+) Transcript_19583:553-828(+)
MPGQQKHTTETRTTWTDDLRHHAGDRPLSGDCQDPSASPPSSRNPFWPTEVVLTATGRFLIIPQSVAVGIEKLPKQETQNTVPSAVYVRAF